MRAHFNRQMPTAYYEVLPRKALDAERDRWLSSQGYSVARYTNNDIYSNLSGVAEDIMMKIGMDI